MANGEINDANQVKRPLKKADVILKHERQINSKTDEIISATAALNARFDEVLQKVGTSERESVHTARQNVEIYNALKEENANIRQEMKYLAVQSENIFSSVTEKLEQLFGELKDLKESLAEAAVAEKEAAPAVAEETETTEEVEAVEYKAPERVVSAEIDYDLLVEKIVARLPVQEDLSADYIANKVIENMPVPTAVVSDGVATTCVQPVTVSAEIDYDLLAEKVAAKLPAQEAVVAPAAEIDYDLMADKVASRLPERNEGSSFVAAPVAVPAQSVTAEVDYDLIADKVVGRIPLQESVSPDYIVSRVAEQIVIPQVTDIDYDELAEKVAEKIPAAQSASEIDYDELARKVAEIVPERETAVAALPTDFTLDYDELAEKVAAKLPAQEAAVVSDVPVNVALDEEELADRIALKVGELKAEDFEVLVDDEGCASISKTLAEKLDYEIISAAVAEKLRTALIDFVAGNEEPDYEEMAARISEKITVAGVNEDAIADKAAAVLSNYLPEIDTDEIADKVASQVISAMPSVDNDLLCATVSEKIIESQADNDYDIVIDEEGLDRITDTVYEKVTQITDERFSSIDSDLEEIKNMLEGGAVIREVAVTGTAAEAYEEVQDEDYVTVSEVVEEYEEEPEEVSETAEESEEETFEESEEEFVEEITEETTGEEIVNEEPEELPETVEEPEEEVVEETVEETEDEAEEDSEDGEDDGAIEEFSYDDLTVGGDETVTGGGVDFANMMKYNRSFIARIIQGTDEQKTYYGEVRNALLSYKKVNSNIAWGAERFHKGRETIARFKIRGKTLVVYLALDPAEHEYSVYHHKDVSSNKSLHGTPMMIKVKSPRGVKKAIRLIDEMLEARNGIKRNIPQRDYAAMYPFETIEELIEDGLVKDVSKK